MPETKLLKGDCLKMMDEVPDSSVDLVLTDPPYSSGGLFSGQRKAKTSSKYCNKNYNGTSGCPDFTGDNRDQFSFIIWGTMWISKAMTKMKAGAIRPLAKLNRHIKVTYTGKQRKPKRESFSSVSISF